MLNNKNYPTKKIRIKVHIIKTQKNIRINSEQSLPGCFLSLLRWRHRRLTFVYTRLTHAYNISQPKQIEIKACNINNKTKT